MTDMNDELDDESKKFLLMHMAVHNMARKTLGLSEAEYRALCLTVAEEGNSPCE